MQPWLFSLLKLCSSSSTELISKALDASTGVDELLLAGVERVALVAEVNPQLALGGVGLPGVATGAAYGALHVVGMDHPSS